MGRLTQGKVEALIRAGKPGVFAVGDGSGLCLSISKAGTVSWELRYRYAGKAHWYTVGRYSEELKLAPAKIKAGLERARIAAGVNPVAERRRSKLAQTSAKTLSELAEDYLARALSNLAEGT
jgi:hypothetical protein